MSRIFLLSLIYLTAISSLMASKYRHWVGSTFGSKNYNKELQVLEQGKIDYENAIKTWDNRKEMLCVTFTRASLRQQINIAGNMRHMRGHCDWAFVIYSGEGQTDSFCNSVALSGHVYCKVTPAIDELNRTSLDVLIPRNVTKDVATNKTYISVIPKIVPNNIAYVRPNVKAAIANRTFSRRSIPKSVMYHDIIHLLRNYKHIFLMDEDISLIETDINKLMSTWACGFSNQPKPLIVQPVVDEDTQIFNFVSKQEWASRGVVASASGYVEQQVPLFDSLFFEWFVRRVLINTRLVSLLGGADWGHDRSWCNAAASYAQFVLGWNESWHPCGVITTAYIHHLNTKSMSFKKTNREEFRTQGFFVTQHYIDMYPTWVLLDVTGRPNPLNRRGKVSYPRYKSVNSTCIELWSNSHLHNVNKAI